MKKYVLTRILKSLLSIFVVVSVVVIMVYTLIPIQNVFQNDTAYKKLQANQKTVYRYNKLEELGYLDFYTINELCQAKSDNFEACVVPGSDENLKALSEIESEGYTVELLDKNDTLRGNSIAYKFYNVVQLITNFYSKLIIVDNPWAIEDPNNPELERKYYIGTSPSGMPAIMCSGCNYKYQLYFDGNFPFIHQNAITLEFGLSYPTQTGIQTVDVINNGQGSLESFEQTFPTGQTTKSPIIQTSCEYKYQLDHLDVQKFTDNYANCSLKYDSPSMVSTSYLFGIVSLIIAYVIALPTGIAMSRNKGKLIDKIGIVYINLLIAVPSLAFIFFLKYIGMFFGLPDRFPQYGFGDVRSYILPMIILGLLSTPSLMMWIRRYMVDQSNSDYVKFAKAKGLSQKEIFRNHILKNAIIPIVNGIPSSVILCISGAVITESVFSIPGMGKMLPDAIKSTNNNMVITLTFIFTALSVFAVLLGDLLMTVVDPRIQLTSKKGG